MTNFTRSKFKIKISAWNACTLSIRKKIELQNFLEQHQIDVIIITETRHTLERPPPKIPKFNLTFSERQQGEYGVAAYVQNDLPFVEEEVATQSMENITIRIGNTRITGVYNRPLNNMEIRDLAGIFDQDRVIAIEDWNGALTEQTARDE